MNEILARKNTAIRRFSKPHNQTVPPKSDVEVQAQDNANATNGEKWNFKTWTQTDNNVYLFAGGLALLLIIAFVVAVKYKLIKL